MSKRWSLVGMGIGIALLALAGAGAGADDDETAVPPEPRRPGQSSEEMMRRPNQPRVPQPEPVVTSTTDADRASHPSSGSDTAQLEQKLNDILEHQTQILQRLDQVMEELRVVKIRATIR